MASCVFLDVKMPGALPVVLSAFVLLTAAVVASWLPAARAARIDVMRLFAPTEMRRAIRPSHREAFLNPRLPERCLAGDGPGRLIAVEVEA